MVPEVLVPIRVVVLGDEILLINITCYTQTAEHWDYGTPSYKITQMSN